MKLQKKAERVLVLPDIHLPEEDTRTMAAVEQYMGDHDWDEVVYLGDLLDLGLISSHNKDNLRAIKGRRLRAEYDYCAEMLDRHQKLAPMAKFTYLEGNHELRVEKYIDANPAMEGSMEVEVGLQLLKRKIQWVRYGTPYKLGKARFIHGMYTNKYHASKHVEAYGNNIFYGHTHDIQLHSKELHGDDKTIVGQSLGCLCKYDQPYLRRRPTRWQQGFGVFYFFPDGYFTYTVVRIFKHRFYAEGEIYQG